MDGEKINLWLKKFEKITPPNIFIRRELKKNIKKIIGINLKIKEIQYYPKTQKIYLKTSPIIKTSIFLKKEEIIKKTNQTLKKRIISEII